MKSVPLAQYLFTRLRQNNVCHMHGVPGDFTLKALDHLKPSGIKWINSCNELNAGYAADGYGRISGLGALFTTYGVGELSAINAIAGSYAEHVPVVSIVGSPQREMHNRRLNVHHTLGDERPGVFAEMAKHVTVAQARLVDENEAPEMIDDVISTCLRQSRPVYVDLPCDMVSKTVDASRLQTPLRSEVASEHERDDELVSAIRKKLLGAKQPLILLDTGRGVRGLHAEINAFVEASGVPTLAMPSGNGMVEHSLPNFYGVHSGPVGAIDTMPYVRGADLVIAFGPMFSDTQTLGWQVVPDVEKTITLSRDSIQFATQSPIPVNLKRFLSRLTETINPQSFSKPDVSSLGNFRNLKPRIDNLNDKIDQDNFYLRINGYIQKGDVVLLANATPILGGRDLVLPESASTIASGQWFSIGHMLPAAQGASLAMGQRSEQLKMERSRTILLEGDGSFQVTAQELSTVIRYKIPLTIFIINNSGYAYERQIHGMEEDYNDLAPWRYATAPELFGSADYQPQDDFKKDYPIFTTKIETWEDLERMEEDPRFLNRKGLQLVEVVVNKFDVPEKFKPVFKAAGDKLS